MASAGLTRITTLRTVSDIEVRRLEAPEAAERIVALAEVLFDCVDGGASVSYMAPFGRDQARAAFETVVADVANGRRILLAAFAAETLIGTVQMADAAPPNQPHRGDVAKLLVHRSARGRGVGQLLMKRLEVEARAEGKTLLVLDAVTNGDAARLYARLGWTTVGVIPNYALFPDGRPCDTTVFYKELVAAPA